MYAIHNAIIVNDATITHGWVVTDGQFITAVGLHNDWPAVHATLPAGCITIDAGQQLLMPGAIDCHVHFRDPGLTHKADMATESAAAVAGGVTSFIDMPNTKPATVTMADVEAKQQRAAQASMANYGFFIGATDSNLDQLLEADYTKVAGVKLFMGSSTGGMLVEQSSILHQIFSRVPALIAVHAESEATIRQARAEISKQYPGGNIPVNRHSDLRPRQACVEATRLAIETARRYDTRLHVTHISTADELQFFTPGPVADKLITAETCPQYLMFERSDFDRLGAKIKCNPAIKEVSDRDALRQSLSKGIIDIIATDHAPHLLIEKQGDALTAVSGMPMIQFSLRIMLKLATEGVLTIPQVAALMSHNPAIRYKIDRRGFIRPGYYADLVLVDPHGGGTVTAGEIQSRCGWSPVEGMSLPHKVTFTMVNGSPVWADGQLQPAHRRPMPLRFGI